jgi:hypothetical protein
MARGESVKSGTKVRKAQYGSGDQVWVGQSRGSMREGTVVRYLGEGSYSVFIPGRGVGTADEALLTLRQEDGGAGGRALEGLLAETGWRELDTEKRSLVGQRRIRWYNPKLGDFEWRVVPKSDEEALSLLEGSPYTPTCTATYRQWRELGSSITVALIRAGEAAKEERDQGASS